MFTKKPRLIVNILIIVSLLVSGMGSLTIGQATTPCESCGMSVDATGQERFKILDAANHQHVACCPVCALRLQRPYGDLNITSFCDYYGPSYPITIISRNNGSDVTVNPSDALIIAAGSCTKNRVVYNSSAADDLLAPPNNGTSKWLSTLSNDTVTADATMLGVVQAALINGVGLTSPSPSPSSSTSATPYRSPTPTSSPEQTSKPTTTPSTTTGGTLECEVCGMDTTPESQLRYKVTDGNGNAQYVECYMCALALVNDYESVHIETFCDWYGPDYPIIVDSSNYGGKVIVSPSTAMFLRGGSCVTARAAYNQTAADNLLLQGFSQFTSPEQLYTLPSSTQVKLVSEAIETWYSQPSTTGTSTSLALVLVAVIGATIVISSVFAYKKLARSKQTGVKT